MANPSDLDGCTFPEPRRGIPGEVEYRHRVVEVLALDEDGRVLSGKIREFKTPEAAERCRDRWVAAGRSAVMQSGVLRWETASDDAVSGGDALTSGT